MWISVLLLGGCVSSAPSDVPLGGGAAPAPAVTGTSPSGSSAGCPLTAFGVEWNVLAGGRGPIGPYRWSCENVRWDAARNQLTLQLTTTGDGRWTGAELRSTTLHGAGAYTITVASGLATLEPSAVLGFFNYGGRDGQDEIDVEFTRWGDARSPGLHYTVWPAVAMTVRDKSVGHEVGRHLGQETSHGFLWSNSGVRFRSRRGALSGAALFEDGDGVFAESRYPVAGDRRAPEQYVPQRPLPIYINLWVQPSAKAGAARTHTIVVTGLSVPPGVGRVSSRR